MNLRFLLLAAAMPSFLHADFFPIRPNFCQQIHQQNPAADAIFIGTVTAESPLRFRVDEAFLGFAAGEIRELIEQPARGCPFPVTFARGRQYLVRARKDELGRWAIPPCSNSTETGPHVEQDIRGLRAWKRGERLLRGFVLDTTRRPGLPPGRSTDAPDLPIRLTGGNGVDRLVRTGPQGLFEFDGLPPGQYQLQFVQKGWSSGSAHVKLSENLDLTLQGCVDMYFDVVENPSAIRGRLVASAGALTAGLIVEAEPVLEPGQEILTRNRRTTSDANGEFTIEKVPAGTYRVVLNPDGKLATTSPYPRSASARTIRAARGEPVDIGDWPLPPPLQERPVRGIVRWKNSKPVAGAIAFLRYSGPKWGAQQRSAPTGADGRFTVTGMPGVDYELIVVARNPAGRGIARSESIRLRVDVAAGVKVALEQIDKPEWYSLRPD